jgi:hypothetical protein
LIGREVGRLLGLDPLMMIVRRIEERGKLARMD